MPSSTYRTEDQVSQSPDFAARIPAEELLRRICGAAPIGVAMFDTAMRYIAVNRHFREQLLIVGDDLIGRGFYDVFPETPRSWRDVHQRCLAGGFDQRDGEPVVHPDGTVEYYRWICWPWHDEDGAIGGLVLLTECVTAAVRQQRDARRWSDAIENAGFGIIIVDATRNTFLYVNPAFAEQHGMAPDQVGGTKVLDTYPRAERERVAGLLAVADTMGNVMFEGDRLRRDGSVFPAMTAITAVRRADGSVPYRVGTVLDITERKLAEAKLRATDARFRCYINNSPVGVFILDAAGAVAESNPAACAMLGYDADAMRGRHVGMLHREEDMADVLRHFDTLRQGGHVQHDYQMRRADGTTFWAIVSAALLPDGSFAGFIQDIDQRKHAEAELPRTQRLTMLGELATGLAHELSQPLMVMGLAAENAMASLAQEGDATAAIGELREIAAAAAHATELFHTIRSFGRTDSGPTTPTNLPRTVRGTLSMVHRRLRDGDVSVSQSFPPDLPPVLLARVKLEQVLTNLILNACDAYATGRATERLISIGARRDGDDVVLTVADRAGGMDEAVLPRVFDPFFTTKPVGCGTGLGLSICYNIATSVGGSLAARNQAGGAVFEVRLPAHVSASQQVRGQS
jgi:PAS domain S-box-containing protein